MALDEHMRICVYCFQDVFINFQISFDFSRLLGQYLVNVSHSKGYILCGLDGCNNNTPTIDQVIRQGNNCNKSSDLNKLTSSFHVSSFEKSNFWDESEASTRSRIDERPLLLLNLNIILEMHVLSLLKFFGILTS